MDGLKTKYLYYKSSGKSEITISRKVLKPSGLNWENGDDISIIVTEIEGKKGIFLNKDKEGETKYLHYEKPNKSSVTIPRAILEFNTLNWNHRDIISLTLKEINGKKGIFLYKKEENKT